MSDGPRITFGIIVLNGEPFTRYCLRSIYPFAHEIIVVEGASPHAAGTATPDGHSTDGTLDMLHSFKADEDPEDKLQVVTAEDAGYPDGFWPGEKDEQSRAYTERATGDYIWQVDIDEFYRAEDIERIIDMLKGDPSINGMSFRWQNFWGGFDYTADGWEYRDQVKATNGIRRIFRWRDGYRYARHRPPTVLDEKDRDLFEGKWVSHKKLARRGIYCYHYGMVFPHQARQKASYYPNLPQGHDSLDEWYENAFKKLNRPFSVFHGLKPPSWLTRFNGEHPNEVVMMKKGIGDGDIDIETRPMDDIERLLADFSYRGKATYYSIEYYFVRALKMAKKAVKRIVGRGPLRFPASKLRRLFRTPIEEMPDAPGVLASYRYLLAHPDVGRVPGGWKYKGDFYPDYLTVGGAGCAIFDVAKEYCNGEGVDIGAGFWPFPGSTPVDLVRGPGLGRGMGDFKEGSLDYIFSSHCLEHIADWRSVLTEWVSKLKPRGMIFLYLPHPACRMWHPGSPFVGDGHVWIPSFDVIKDGLEKAGCKILESSDGPDVMMSFYVAARKT